MNKIHKALFSLFAFFVGHEAHAATPCATYNGTTPSSALIVGTAQHSNGTGVCTGYTTSYRYSGTSTSSYIKVVQCSGCISNFKTDIQTKNVNGCSINVTGCTTCGNCTNCSDTDWTTPTNGLQSRTTATCTDRCSNTCSKETEYRCIAGYYGSPGNTTSGCYKCPTSGGLEGTSTLGFNETIEDCYFPANTPVDDSTGTYKFTASCFYSS